MIIQIGIIAGDIWHYLDANGKEKLSRLVLAVGKSRDLVLMSLGWLAREGHVILEGEGDYEVYLRQKEAVEKEGV